jgi:ankyrin repeat protein
VEQAAQALRDGADINVRMPGGGTPLHLAIQLHHDGLAAFLIGQGAHVKLVDDYGSTPLHLAVLDYRSGLASLLIGQGADPLAADKQGLIPPDLVPPGVDPAWDRTIAARKEAERRKATEQGIGV